MTADRILARPRIEVEQREPLVIRPGEEFFPLADISVDIPSNFNSWRALDRAVREFTIEDDKYGVITGRFFFRYPFSGGNASILQVAFLPQRFYTLATKEDDLTKIDCGNYPGKPRERFELAMGIDLPGTVGDRSMVNFTGDFGKIAQLQVINHITGKTFNAIRQKAWVGCDETACPHDGQFTLIYDQFYYEGEEPVTEHQFEANLEMYAQQDLSELRKGKEISAEGLRVRREKTDAINNERSFKEPFHLAFVRVPRVMGQIGMTLSHRAHVSH